MKNSIEKIENSLFTETDGFRFSNITDRLLKNYSEAEREKVIDILMKYAREGQILHWRNFLMTSIIKLIREGESRYSSFFEWSITQPNLIYWSIDGILKTQGKDGYNLLINLMGQENLSTEIRGKAIKSIALFSKQPFDRALPKDPGHWKSKDLRIKEVLEWHKSGCEDGKGYSEPIVHPSLKDPQTELEKTVAKLDRKLEAKRKKQQDLSNPSNWLAIADESDIEKIEQKWELPSHYLLFLKYYSPINVFIFDKASFQDINLYSSKELIEAQDGYSYNSTTGTLLDEWPANFVVVADAGADPYCIDIGDVSNGDGPIYTAMHGMGTWDFEKYADSFIDFLKLISKK